MQPHKSERWDEPWRHRHKQLIAARRGISIGSTQRGQILAKRNEMATAGTVMPELKLSVGKFRAAIHCSRRPQLHL